MEVRGAVEVCGARQQRARQCPTATRDRPRKLTGQQTTVAVTLCLCGADRTPCRTCKQVVGRWLHAVSASSRQYTSVPHPRAPTPCPIPNPKRKRPAATPTPPPPPAARAGRI